MTTRRRQLGPQFSMDEATAPTAAPAPPAREEPGNSEARSTTARSTTARPPATVDESNSEPRNLGKFLGGSLGADDEPPAPTGGASVELAALAGHRRVDPDKDLVQLNVTIPWYVRRAMDLTCTAEQIKLRELILHWARHGLSPQLLAECRAVAERDRTRQ